MTPYTVRAWDPERDRRAFVAPLIATVVSAPLMVLDAVCVLFSPMATDSCTAHGCRELDRALLAAPCVLLLAWAALGLSWALPWRLRYRAARVAPAVAAPLLAAATLLIYLHLPAAD